MKTSALEKAENYEYIEFETLDIASNTTHPLQKIGMKSMECVTADGIKMVFVIKANDDKYYVFHKHYLVDNLDREIYNRAKELYATLKDVKGVIQPIQDGTAHDNEHREFFYFIYRHAQPYLKSQIEDKINRATEIYKGSQMLNFLTKLSEILAAMQNLSIVHMGIQPSAIQCSEDEVYIADIEDCVHYSSLAKSYPYSVGYVAYMAPETKEALSTEEFFSNQNLVKMSIYSMGKLAIQMIGLLEEEAVADQNLARFLISPMWKKYRQQNDKTQMEKLELIIQAMLEEKHYERVDFVGVSKLLLSCGASSISDLMNLKATEKEASQSRHNAMVSLYK
jgi:hypothetical protein